MHFGGMGVKYSTSTAGTWVHFLAAHPQLGNNGLGVKPARDQILVAASIPRWPDSQFYWGV